MSFFLITGSSNFHCKVQSHLVWVSMNSFILQTPKAVAFVWEDKMCEEIRSVSLWGLFIKRERGLQQMSTCNEAEYIQITPAGWQRLMADGRSRSAFCTHTGAQWLSGTTVTDSRDSLKLTASLCRAQSAF